MTILNKIGIDRVLHFAFGGWIACLATTWYWAIFIAFYIGLIKECHDYFARDSSFDLKDWLATTVGGCVTAIVIFVL